MQKFFLLAGTVNLFLTVAIGAFAAHGLKGKITEQLMAVFQTGVQYHGMHALGLLLIGVLSQTMPDSIWLKWSGYVILVGIILFSGSLYALALTGNKSLGMITPFGGMCFLAGWTLLATAVVKY